MDMNLILASIGVFLVVVLLLVVILLVAKNLSLIHISEPTRPY